MEKLFQSYNYLRPKLTLFLDTYHTNDCPECSLPNYCTVSTMDWEYIKKCYFSNEINSNIEKLRYLSNSSPLCCNAEGVDADSISPSREPFLITKAKHYYII